MTIRKKESALGKGLDALIRPDFTDEEKKEQKSKISTNERRRKDKVKSDLTKSNKYRDNNKTLEHLENKSNGKDIKNSVDQTLVENVILEVRKNPRISLWSAKSAAVLRLLKKTKPEFSISKEASALIEEAVKDKYPELWEEIKDREI
jgi:signal recognition particle GTPase